MGDASCSAKLSSENLAMRFEAAGVDSSAESYNSESDPSTMKVTELRNELLDFGYKHAAVRKMRKAELVALVVKARTQKPSAEESSLLADETTQMQTGCTFFILDENLQRFPIEGLECFRHRTVCRLPSLPFALAKLMEVGAEGETSGSFDPRRISYVLDPESNLGGTRERLVPFIETMNSRHGREWKSVIGDVPSAGFFEEALAADQGLLLYFGHGGGQKFLSRRKIEALIQPKLSHASSRLINSSVILMGCSSGKLESVNMTGSAARAQVPLYYEPEGVALSYLMAGAPCVVGNLWDVTDYDIDRFSLSLLEKIFEGGQEKDSAVSIAQGVAEARSACKLRSIVGCAPVCYGLPICAKRTTTFNTDLT